MKRIGFLYEQIYDMENLKEALAKASCFKKKRESVIAVLNDPEKFLVAIQRMLKNEEYVVSKYKIRTIKEYDKKRKLKILPFYPDRIIQWAIVLVIEKHLTNKFVYHTCASLPGRGQNRAITLLTKYLHDDPKERSML